MDWHITYQPNPRENEASWLQTIYMHEGYYEIATLIMSSLSASNVAALLAALKVKLSAKGCEKYLHPLRDVDPTMQIFQPWFRDDCEILMMGPDTSLLKERVRNPEAYYEHYRGREPPQLEAWVVGIPPTSKSDYQKRVKRVTRLKRKWYDKRKDPVVRAEALLTLEDILNKDVLRQCLCLYDGKGPDVDTVVGESILVKSFDLLDCSLKLNTGPVGLRFLGMQFRLPWNINMSTMPYIDAAYPFCSQLATAPCTDFGNSDAALIFNCRHPAAEGDDSAVSIQTNVFRDGLF